MSESPFSLPAKGSTSSAVAGDQATGSVSIHEALRDGPEPEEDNFFVAAQKGDVDTLKRLIESGKATATDRDEQNITALHWAAINAQIPACKYLLDQGSEIDALGGDLVATPMQWAARNGYLYVIQLLIAHGADPTIKDSQGYNTLHLVTHSSVVMALLYVLQQPVAVDSSDAQGHTALMWAAYQGDALSVDVLLKHGAGVNTKDSAGLTPLHWAVVRGNKLCIRNLLECGADISAKDENGKTAKDMATELKSLGSYRRAFEEAGLNVDGSKKKQLLSDRNTKFAVFLSPMVFLYFIFLTLRILPWYTGILLALAEFFGMHHVVSRVLLDPESSSGNVTHSPYFAGIITGSMIWVAWAWFTSLVHNTPGYALTNLSFALVFMLCAYNFFRAITLDPGYCPKPMNDAELKEIIEDLASSGNLNGHTFCVNCMAKKPLRSKHCRICDKCTAKHDHHCPWVWNCVGVNNHRQFVLFVATLVIGVMLFDYLAYVYFSSLEISTIPVDGSCIFPDNLCQVTSHDPYLAAVTVWATIQLSWTIVLLASQLYQIARQMTTLEVSNLGRYGFMGGRGGPSLSVQQGHQHTHGDGAHTHRHQHKKICGNGFLMQLLGLDRFTKGKAVDGMARAGKAPNPFDHGFLSNCRDFWSGGQELGVEYERLYQVPAEGFQEAKRRREDVESQFATRPKRKGLFNMGLSWGRGSRQGYLPVHHDDHA